MYPISFITRKDQNQAAQRLGVPLAVIKAIMAVEARGSGFIKNTDLPSILFEGHLFHKFTRGVYDNHYPHLSYPKWTTRYYKGGRGEYDRLIEAISVSDEPDPALMSTSWGLFQIMGSNHEAAGHATVREFVNAMAESEGNQLAAFVTFLESKPELLESLRGQAWTDFAARYNGPGYKKNQYDTKLAAEFSRVRIKLDEEASGDQLAFERGDTASLQSALNVALDAGLTVDGWFGDKTRQALIRFQEREGLEETGKVDAETCARLNLDVSSYSLEA